MWLARDLVSCRPSCSSRSSSGAGARAPTAAGSAPAARSPRRWATRSAEDAARPVLEPAQHGGAGDPRSLRSLLLGSRDRRLDAGRTLAGPTHWYRQALRQASRSLNYYWCVDIFLAGIVGVGLYFWFRGRVWCRFACPLAALMHIYTRFSRFRIFPDKRSASPATSAPRCATRASTS